MTQIALLVNLAFQCSSPRWSERNPLSRAWRILSDWVVHSRFCSLLSDLFPLRWLT